MIKFSIDYFDETLFFKKLDYSNKLILNAVSDPLFIYDSKSKKYLIKGKKMIIYLRNDLFFYDGKKVTAKDYIDAIKENLSKINSMKNNIKSVICENEKIEIQMKYQDKNILSKLSCYFFSPHLTSTSGRYFIYKITDKDILLKPNVYYRNKAKNDLKYIKLKTYQEDQKAFERKIVDISNNTFFNLNSNNKNNEKSGIIISLELSTKIKIEDRELIVKSINKNNLISKLGNAYYLKNDFSFENYSNYKFKRKINYHKKTIVLMYNDFYPNYEIAKSIKSELESNNYQVILKEETYENLKIQTQYDIKLTLNYFEYISDFYFYESKYFTYIMKENLFYKYLVKKQINCSLVNKLFKKQYIKEPLISFYSNFHTNDMTNEFSYLDCDYNKLK